MSFVVGFVVGAIIGVCLAAYIGGYISGWREVMHHEADTRDAADKRRR